MNPDFIEILCNPLNGNSLVSKKDKFLDEKTNQTFDYSKGVAILLNTSEPLTKNSEIHNKLNTSFNYQEHYEKDAVLFNYFDKKLDKATKHENRRLHESIWRKIAKNPSYILDVGCGEAWVAKMALPSGINIISMDISTINPTKAVNRFPSKKHLGLVADAFQLPIKGNSIDTIIASEIMEHVADPKDFIASLFKSLKPKGKLIITTPYNEKLEYCLCIHCNNPTPRHAHIHSFNEQNIKQLIPENSNWRFHSFSNFYLTKLRMHILLAWMPHFLWKIVDSFANKLSGKPTRLLLEIEKK